MTIIKNWGYGETQDYKDGSEWKRRNVRFVGKMNKSQFVKTILNGDTLGKKWILDRMSDTANKFELELISKYPNKIVCYDDRTYEIIKILDKFAL